jgi:hypothetical protein
MERVDGPIDREGRGHESSGVSSTDGKSSVKVRDLVVRLQWRDHSGPI